MTAQSPGPPTRTIMLITEKPPQGLALGLAAVSLAGVLFCALLLMQMGQNKSLAMPMLCGQVSGCELVQQSRWGRLGPVPASTLGLAYFTVLASWLLTVGRPNSAARGWHLFPTILLSLGCGLSVYYLYVMFVVLRALCPLCIAVHVANFLLLAGVLWLWPRRRRNLPPNHAVMPAPSVRLAVTALVLAVSWSLTMVTAAAAGLAVMRKAASPELAELVEDVDFVRFLYERSEYHHIPIGPADPIRGPADAPHSVVVFDDFQCPACAKFEKIWKDLPEALRERSRLIFKHYPLHSRCNAQTTTNIHFFSCDAARAAEAARRLGGQKAFWRAYDWLFEHRLLLDVRPYRRMAEAIDLDPDQLLAEMQAPEVTERIRTDSDLGGSLEPTGTPTVFLNGRKVQLWNVSAFWEQALAEPPLPASRPSTQPSTAPADESIPEDVS